MTYHLPLILRHLHLLNVQLEKLTFTVYEMLLLDFDFIFDFTFNSYCILYNG